MRRLVLAALIALVAVGAAGASSAQAAEDCYHVPAHSGRQSPARAYNLHVFDSRNGLPIYWAYANSEGWYFTRLYPNGHLAKVLWHDPKQRSPQWISNYSDADIWACFYQPR